jgi:acyl-coenzyme A synthetase/AMP-(fatty) acid ligase/acyl carrier protein
LSFDVSVYEFFSALLYGGTLHLVPEDVRLSNARFIPWLAKHEIRSAYIPAFMLWDVYKYLEREPGQLALRRVLVGVEPIPEQLLAEICKKLKGLHIVNGYGPTEATVCATFYEIDERAARERRTPIGKPLSNLQIYLLDHHLQPVPIGSPAQLFISGPALARGYLRLPALTAERFIPHPWSQEPGQRLYRTGDVARQLTGGEVEYIGRRDGQVKLRGQRMELGEIESVLRGEGGIRECVVMVREGEGVEGQLVAYVVEQERAEAEEESQGERRERWRRHVGRRLPQVMVPQVYVVMERMPLLPSGKPDRQALARLGQEFLRANSRRAYAAARPGAEQLVAGVWREVLGVKDVDIDANFFELGGHSLKMVKAHSLLQEEFQREISLPSMFEFPTVRSLAEYLDQNASAGPQFEGIMKQAERQRQAIRRQQQHAREGRKRR